MTLQNPPDDFSVLPPRIDFSVQNFSIKDFDFEPDPDSKSAFSSLWCQMNVNIKTENLIRMHHIEWDQILKTF